MSQGELSSLTADVAIIGGGIVGLSAGLELQSRGRSVVVIDPGDPLRRASHGNAGVLSRGSILPVAGPGIWKNLFRFARGVDPGVRLRYRSVPSLLDWYRRFLASSNEGAVRSAAAALNPLAAMAIDRHLALGAIADTLPLIRRDGWLRLYRSDASFAGAALERELLAAYGVQVELLSGDAIYDLEPSVARYFAHGLLFPQTGSVITPGEVVRRYEVALRARGGQVVAGAARGLRQAEAGVELFVGETRIRAGHAVLSAGAWSGALARDLGYRVPFASERGHHAHFRLKEGASLGRAVNDTRAGFVIAPMGDTVRVLTGVELCNADDPPDFRQLELAVANAARMLPLGERVGESWFGNRPSTPDGLPVIGFAPDHDRIVFAFGHGHIGLSTGPVTGEIVARLICNEAQTLPIAPFDISRFPSIRRRG